MTTSTLITPSPDTGPAHFLWGTTVLAARVELDGIVRPAPRPRGELPDVVSDGTPCQQIPAGLVLTDEYALTALFLEAMNAACADASPVTEVDITVQVWRAGHGIPAEANPADWIAWCYLTATPAPSKAESGCLSLADPRPASDQTAMPGLPWGRAIIVRPIAGNLVVAPGWLTTSVVPVETGQNLIVAIATSAR